MLMQIAYIPTLPIIDSVFLFCVKNDKVTIASHEICTESLKMISSHYDI